MEFSQKFSMILYFVLPWLSNIVVSLDLVVCLCGPIDGPKVHHIQNVLTPVVTMATGGKQV